MGGFRGQQVRTGPKLEHNLGSELFETFQGPRSVDTVEQQNLETPEDTVEEVFEEGEKLYIGEELAAEVEEIMSEYGTKYARDGNIEDSKKGRNNLIYDLKRPERELSNLSEVALRCKLASLTSIASSKRSTEEQALRLLTVKQERFNYFSDYTKLMKELVRISLSLRDVHKQDRKEKLCEKLEAVNQLILDRKLGPIHLRHPSARKFGC